LEKPTRTKRPKAKQSTPTIDAQHVSANTSPAHPAQSTPVPGDNAASTTFIPYAQPNQPPASSPPANGPITLPPIQSAAHSNGTPTAQEDVAMTEAPPSGGFTAVNRVT
jgi:hypothetical protein